MHTQQVKDLRRQVGLALRWSGSPLISRFISWATSTRVPASSRSSSRPFLPLWALMMA